jgi:hypothetical protein
MMQKDGEVRQCDGVRTTVQWCQNDTTMLSEGQNDGIRTTARSWVGTVRWGQYNCDSTLVTVRV